MSGYRVIGTDGVSYEAPDLSTLQQWVNEGRVTPEMSIQMIATGQLLPAKIVPGLTFPSGAPPPNPRSPFETQAAAQYPRTIGNEIPDHLVKSIIATACCCMPLGIVSIIFATQTSSHKSRGDYEAALTTSAKASAWANWAIGLGLLSGVFWAIVQILVETL